MRNEESSGDLENLLVRPVARWQWLGGRLGGRGRARRLRQRADRLAAWVGTTTQGADVGFGDLLEAGSTSRRPPCSCSGSGRSRTGSGHAGRRRHLRDRRLVVRRRDLRLAVRLARLAEEDLADPLHHARARRRPGLDGGGVVDRARAHRRGGGRGSLRAGGTCKARKPRVRLKTHPPLPPAQPTGASA